ncbi:hypothetical protein GR268_45800, partial [Rhizobium leguminosarum]|nr:hypothetical protein [Rhizobium leguminosarum]
TGYREAGIVGVENKPFYITDIRAWSKDKIIDFKNEKLIKITHETIPSFAFYYLMGHVKNLPQEFWPHLQGTSVTSVHTVDLRQNRIRAQGAEAFAKHLQGTQVHTLDLSWNGIGAQGAEALAKNIQGTQVHTLDLSWNGIGAQGAEALAKNI